MNLGLMQCLVSVLELVDLARRRRSSSSVAVAWEWRRGATVLSVLAVPVVRTPAC